MTLSNMIVRETAENQFVIGMLLTSGSAKPAQDIFENKSLGTFVVELPTGARAQRDYELEVKVRCFHPN